jgi:hypothetical protein
VSWVDDLTVDLEHSVRVIEAKLVARTPKMLRGAIKPLSDDEVREISSSISWAVSSAILKAHDTERHTNRKGAA